MQLYLKFSDSIRSTEYSHWRFCGKLCSLLIFCLRKQFLEPLDNLSMTTIKCSFKIWPKCKQQNILYSYSHMLWTPRKTWIIKSTAELPRKRLFPEGIKGSSFYISLHTDLHCITGKDTHKYTKKQKQKKNNHINLCTHLIHEGAVKETFNTRCTEENR